MENPYSLPDGSPVGYEGTKREILNQFPEFEKPISKLEKTFLGRIPMGWRILLSFVFGPVIGGFFGLAGFIYHPLFQNCTIPAWSHSSWLHFLAFIVGLTVAPIIGLSLPSNNKK